MKLLRTAVIFVAVLAIFGAGATVMAAEQWATDPDNGSKICILLPDDRRLVSASWSGAAADGLAEGKGKLQYVYKDKDNKETRAQADAEMKAGKLNGKVSIKWSTGDSYDGTYQGGLFDGPGTYRFASGASYEGEWKNGRYEGRGILKFSGILYDGEFKNNNRDGKGVQKWPDGATYEGDWKDDKREGKGVFKQASGDRYEGDWQNDAPNGYGTIVRVNGETYQGGMRNSSHHGQGTYRWPNGETFEGEWKNGVRDGKGINKLPNGEIYEGEYKNNSREGQGIYTWPNGNVYRGEFKSGLRNGQGIMTDAGGKIIFEGQWKDDKPLSAAGAVNTPGTATAAKIDKVLGIPWGASVDEARRILKERPGTDYWFTNKEGNAIVQSYIGPFNNERASIHVHFYQGKMFQVIIGHLLSEVRLLDKFDEMKRGMTQRYGLPSSESGKFIDSSAIWNLGGDYKAGLRIRKNPYKNQPDRPFEIQLSYWHRGVYLQVHPEEGSNSGSGKDF